MDFKQWHEDGNNVFNRETKLYFAQCDINEDMNLSELLMLTSDSGVEDYDQRGMTYRFLKERSIAILVSRIAFNIHKMPKRGDFIRIKTWEDKPEGIQLIRNYQLFDGDGQLLVSGKSAWMVVNPETRRIQKPSVLLELRPDQNPGIPVDAPACGKIIHPQDLELLDERKIRYSEVDANGHVNNSKYGNFIKDSLPGDLQKKEIKSFRLNYAHEVGLNDTLAVYGGWNREKGCYTLVGKKDSDVCFESELYFK